jgi:hypothetical protein
VCEQMGNEVLRNGRTERKVIERSFYKTTCARDLTYLRPNMYIFIPLYNSTNLYSKSSVPYDQYTNSLTIA